jgi:hypothetical protein
MLNHRWSGWPGAWCLDCGIEDQNEIALADGTIEPDGDDKDLNPPCPEPGSNRHNPYVSATDA